MTNTEPKISFGQLVNSGDGRIYYKKMIEDTCDYCLELRYMYRKQITWRTKGMKFMCWQCRQDPGNKDIIKTDTPLKCYSLDANK